jgi:iduronate 2-sulfatase
MIRLFSLFFCLATVAQAQPLNVLFIMADDYRPELHSYGSQALTPHLDQLAKRSLQFNRAYCQQAVCNPSRSSMLTGLRPDTLGLWNNSTHFRELKPDVLTLPQHFKAQGYDTRCCGKIFHNMHTKEKGDARSWSQPEFLYYDSHGNDVPKVQGAPPENLAKFTGDKSYSGTAGFLSECRDVPDEAYFDGRVAAEAVKTLQSLPADKPFFLAVGFWKPHAPFNAPKKYWDLYQRDQLPPLNAARPSRAVDIAFHDSPEVLRKGKDHFEPTAEQTAEMRHGYFANISYMDAQLGKVLQALAQHPAAQNTIVIFFSDHGYHIGEHTLWGKTSCFEYDAHVPMMIQAPGKESGQTHALVELIDLFPTLTELAGVPTPQGLDGTSFAPLLADPQKAGEDFALTQHPRPAYFDRTPSKRIEVMGYSLRTAECRYTEWRDWTTGKTVAKELYDAVKDTAELSNLADQPDSAEMQARAQALLQKAQPAVAHP